MSIFDASRIIRNKMNEPHPLDEDGLRNEFLNLISQSRHIKSFEFTQRSEKKNGAD